MNKGQETRLIILEAGLEMATCLGLENVTIGALAKATNMSKSGLFAHFRSKENLQIEILNHAGRIYFDTVIAPAIKKKAGVVRIKAFVTNWIAWEDKFSGGCIFVSSSVDYSNRPGNIRQHLLDLQVDWLESLKKLADSAKKAGDFRSDADSEQFAFELYALMLGYHHYCKLLRYTIAKDRLSRALNRLLEEFQH